MPSNKIKSARHRHRPPVSLPTGVCLLLVVGLALATCSLAADTKSANSTAPQRANTKSVAKQLATKSEAKSASSKSPNQQVAEQQQEQPTDLSSMYVQIPIAEPADAGQPAPGGHQDQQVLGDEAAGEPSKASTWTGPWPKKFQIGYIKQSDLHQVLIESLKSEPFVGLQQPTSVTGKTVQPTKGGPTAAPGKTTSPLPAAGKAPSSDSGSLMAPQPKLGQQPAGQQYQQQQVAAGGGATFNQLAQLARTAISPNGNFYQAPNLGPHRAPPQASQSQSQAPRNGHLQMRMFANQQRAAGFRQPQPFHRFPMALPIGQQRDFGRGQQQVDPRLVQMTSSFPQQFQFAGLPAFKNQPIYTTMGAGYNPNPQLQQPLDADQLQLMQLANQGPQTAGGLGAPAQVQILSGRPQKSAEYYSSWRPVTAAEEKEQQTGGAASKTSTGQGSSSESLNDGFDDGFAMPPAKDSSAAGMNRHPALNSYLSGEQAMGKLSPTLVSAKMLKQTGTKTASGGSSSSSSLPATGGRKTAGTKLDSERRALGSSSTGNETTTTTTSTTMAPIEQTTMSTGSEAESSSTTPATTTTTTTSPGQPTTPVAEAAETTEPDSEVIDSTDAKTTEQEPPDSTERSAMEAGARSSTAPSQVLDETEVATRSPSGSATGSASSSLPPVPGAGDDSGGQTTLGREETTPSSSASSTAASAPGSTGSGPTKGGEIEGSTTEAPRDTSTRSDASLSDEALMAAAVKASEQVNKSRLKSGAPGGSTKKARSSERLVQETGGRKSGTKSSSPAAAAKLSGQRTGKQVSGEGTKGVKSGSLQRAGEKLAAKAGGKKAKGSKKASRKSTRMASSQPAQIVSMSAAQAQSTAQSLASLLLARCLSSTNCAHLLDVCSTKQAAVPLGDSSAAGSSSAGEQANQTAGGHLIAGWSVAGLQSSKLMSLMGALQAERALGLFPAWRDAIENVVDQDAPAGYTLLVPSNEAIERLPASQVEALLSQGELMSALIEQHILDGAETLELASATGGARQPGPGPRSRFIRSKGLQVNQHRDRQLTINGKRVVYANQPGPGE